MIIEFEKAASRIRQSENRFRKSIIDIMSPFDEDLDEFLDRLSRAGLHTIGDVIDNYDEEEFFQEFQATENERKKVIYALKGMNLQFTG